MPKTPLHSGLILLDKVEGPTSHDLVDLVRKALSQKEVGHLGTLDPMASGLMGMLVGKATKLAPYLSDLNKLYQVEIILGLTSSTLDISGEIVPNLSTFLANTTHRPSSGHSGQGLRALDRMTLHQGLKERELQLKDPLILQRLIPREAFAINLARVRKALASFRGLQAQVPPAFSAIKKGGVSSFKLARQGKALVLEARDVRCYSLELGYLEGPFVGLKALVSSGYYIRSLARDLSEALGLTTGAVYSLRRQKVGPYTLSQAAKGMDKESLLSALIPPRDMLPGFP
ncbi:MAG: hypothetical protein LBE27_02220, partial [Deltaproteobacteria bacterium]|nr:hypothetical protein [Deltaproteobacteria bacterium]